MLDRIPKLIIIAAIVATLCTPADGAEYRQSWRDLTTPPEDSLEAGNTRIWLPVEHKNRCRVTIDIFDSSGQKVRTLFNSLLGEGYYNFWWNKLDDSMQVVPPGEYSYEVTDQCGGKREGKLIAAYREWETKCIMALPDGRSPDGVIVELSDDSALVSAVVHTFDGELADNPFTDSLLNRGKHELVWNPPGEILPGRYKMTVTVGDYSQTFIIWNKK